MGRVDLDTKKIKEINEELAKGKVHVDDTTKSYLELLEVQSKSADFSFSFVESIKEAQGITDKRLEFDKNLLGINKKISREIYSQRDGIGDINSVEKQILKNTNLIHKSIKLNEK